MARKKTDAKRQREQEDGAGAHELLDGSSSASSDGEETLRMNAAYAARFAHNKAREEKQRLEEVYGTGNGETGSSSESSSTDDEEAALATDEIDSRIAATIAAIRSRDPRVYDKATRFFDDAGNEIADPAQKKAKPMFLKDYHRETLLANGNRGTESSYVEQQDGLRDDVIRALHAAADGEQEDDLLVARPGRKVEPLPATTAAKDEQDEETFLSNYVTSNRWRAQKEVPTYAEIVEDDDEFEARAEAFEDEFNSRFEVQGHTRDLPSSVRRETADTGRQREREKKKQRKLEERERLQRLVEQEKAERADELAKATGITDWDVDDSDFDEGRYEKMMAAKFGESWYAEKESKPEFADEIDLPEEVQVEESRERVPGRKRRRQEKQEKKEKKEREEQKEKKEREEEKEKEAGEAHAGLGFVYRQVSPESFGLTAADILAAEDKQLNEFAGLKTLATYRPAEKKARDRKKLKKARRLREFRATLDSNVSNY